MRKKEIEGFFYLIIIVVIISSVYSFIDSVGFFIPLIIVVIIIGISVWMRKVTRRKRKLKLLTKYNDDTVVERIMSEIIWQGETSEQLLDSLGNPYTIDTKILKTKKKEVWKYNPISRTRYRSKIFLEDDKVVGWEDKT